MQSVCDDNLDLDCKLIDSERIDNLKNFNKCVDGATALKSRKKSGKSVYRQFPYIKYIVNI